MLALEIHKNDRGKEWAETLKKTTFVTFILAALLSTGIYFKVYTKQKPFHCSFDSAKWASAGLPLSTDPETVFNRAFQDEGSLAKSDFWAVDLNCSAQEPAIGRLFKRYLVTSPKRWPLLALAVWGLSTSERHESAANTSKRFAKIFSTPEAVSFFSKGFIDSATQKLKTGDLSYADALLAVTEQKLDEMDRSRLRAMVRSFGS